ncbi:MAG: haloalkane dehalogenase [Gammaproteobacteria bacterium]|nr:haloalkane dehalogenase [Gammaproteobacteria bacterium]
MISPDMPFRKHHREVLGRTLAYVDEGDGAPIVLLHGNPTSSYLWRNVIPALAGSGRVIVPDLIGHGDSDKLPPEEGTAGYSLLGTYRYLAALLVELGITDRVTLVGHDWGSALAFHWAFEHPAAMRALAYMEAVVMPLEWDDWPENARAIFQGFRSERGEELVLERNLFIDRVLPGSIIRELSDEEMAAYNAPYSSPEERRPLLNWPRQLPIAGEPEDVVALVARYSEWLSTSTGLPKLFINAEPGSILVGRQREYCRAWPNQTEVTVPGLHFIQEDSPVEIGQAVATWLGGL